MDLDKLRSVPLVKSNGTGGYHSILSEIKRGLPWKLKHNTCFSFLGRWLKTPATHLTSLSRCSLPFRPEWKKPLDADKKANETITYWRVVLVITRSKVVDAVAVGKLLSNRVNSNKNNNSTNIGGRKSCKKYSSK